MSNLLSGTPAYLFEALQQLANLCHCTCELNPLIETAIKDSCERVNQLIESYKEQMFAVYLVSWWNASQDVELAAFAGKMDNPTYPHYRRFHLLHLGAIQISRLRMEDLKNLASAASKVADELLNVHSEEWTEVDDEAA